MADRQIMLVFVFPKGGTETVFNTALQKREHGCKMVLTGRQSGKECGFHGWRVFSAGAVEVLSSEADRRYIHDPLSWSDFNNLRVLISKDEGSGV